MSRVFGIVLIFFGILAVLALVATLALPRPDIDPQRRLGNLIGGVLFAGFLLYAGISLCRDPKKKDKGDPPSENSAKTPAAIKAVNYHFV